MGSPLYFAISIAALTVIVATPIATYLHIRAMRKLSHSYQNLNAARAVCVLQIIRALATGERMAGEQLQFGAFLSDMCEEATYGGADPATRARAAAVCAWVVAHGDDPPTTDGRVLH